MNRRHVSYDVPPSLHTIHVQPHPAVHRICNRRYGSIAMDSVHIVSDNFLACPSKVLASAQGTSPPLSTDSVNPKGELDHISWAGKLPSIFQWKLKFSVQYMKLPGHHSTKKCSYRFREYSYHCRRDYMIPQQQIQTPISNFAFAIPECRIFRTFNVIFLRSHW